MKNIILISVCFLFVSGTQAQPSDQIIERSGAKINFRIIGDGKPILLLSGGPGFSLEYMAPIADQLSKSFQCILLDQRGTGKSLAQNYDTTSINISATIEDIEFLRKHLGYEEWIVLGHSYGGLLASKYASVYPSSVSTIILVSTVGFNTSLWDYFGDNLWSRLLPSDKELAEYWNDSIIVANDFKRSRYEYQKAIMPAYFYDRKNSLLYTQKMKPEDWNIDVFRFIWRDMNKMDLSQISRSYNKPVFVLHGRQDPVGESIPLAVSQTYPNSKLVFIEQAGHLPWLEQPEIFTAAIISFLNNH
jgi:proline iminopeptidase